MIAIAKLRDAIVITGEIGGNENRPKIPYVRPKIPYVCEQIGVECIGFLELIRREG